MATYTLDEVVGKKTYSLEEVLGQPQQEVFDPTEGNSGMQNFLIGAGKGMTDIYQGGKQMLGMASDAEIAQKRKTDEAIMNTTGGKIGNLIGQAATFAPAALIPGANTYVGASLIGAGSGAMQPVTGDESRLLNTGAGAVGGVIGQKLGNVISKKIGQSVSNAALSKSKNAVQDATLANAQKAGYVVPPSQAGAGFGSRLLEGLSGKYKTNQLASIKNQQVTDDLVRKSLNLPDNVPLTSELMQKLRNDAYKTGYEPIKNLGFIRTDNDYAKAIGKIEALYKGAEKSFPNAPKSGVDDLVNSIRVGSFNASDAVDMIRVLREQADSAYRGGNNALGKASREAASAIEDQIERSLGTAQISDDVMAQFMPKPPDISTPPKDNLDEFIPGLQSMAKNAGWSEKGGRIIRDSQTGEVSGRTTWVPNDPNWWKAGLGKDEVQQAVKKVTQGQKLTKKESSIIDYMVDFLKQSDIEASPKIPSVDVDNSSAEYNSILKNAMPLAEPEAAPFPKEAMTPQQWKEFKSKEANKLLQNFRNARQFMAKTHTVEDAIKEGSGRVAASKLAARVQKGKPMTGELKTIGEFANNFPAVTRIPEAGYANPLTVVDYGVGALGYGVNPYAVALPAGRVAARYGILSKPYQKTFVKPSYGSSVMRGLDTPLLGERPADILPYLGLLGGSTLASQ